MKDPKENFRALIFDLLFILVLLTGTLFRTVGLNWDANQHLHPDERFLTMVESAIQPIGVAPEKLGAPPSVDTQPWRQNYAHEMPNCQAWGGYFDTFCSPLNPNNRGFDFFVYGTLPIFLVRYVAEYLGQTGYDQVFLVGRQLSALADLGSVVLLYLIVSRLYNRKVAVLAAAFSALAVAQIQQSHFFTVDNFATFFIFLTSYFAVRVGESVKDWQPTAIQGLKDFVLHPLFGWSLAFGLALGMAVASKLNTVPVAILLPAAIAIGLWKRKDIHDPRNPDRLFLLIAGFLIVGALASLLAFRVAQPYAFSGPGFFGVAPNPNWVDDIIEQRAQASGDIDVPFALQWARRSVLFSFTNLTVWGLGLPLGVLAWAGFLWMGWRIFKGEWRQHLLLWGWTAFYFTWQSLQFNPTMRYQLPIYPLLAMMAAWLVFRIAEYRSRPGARQIALGIGAITLILTFNWALAFTQIYTRDHTRVAATQWIYEHVPAAVNLQIDTPDGSFNQPIPYPNGYQIQPDSPWSTNITIRRSGTLNAIKFFRAADTLQSGTQELRLRLSPRPDSPAEETLSSAALLADFSADSDLRGESYTLPLSPPVQVFEGQVLSLHVSTSGGALSITGAAPANESSWDDGLPLRMHGYDGFGGLYQGGLNFEMYWADDANKLTRFVDTLNQADYLFISSNRQWATIPRVPERYPLSTAYYTALIGCPPEQDVIWCYNVAKPGQFNGQLGFELIKVFESFPTINIPDTLYLEINTQFAEEAFTVYDAPKVLIFKKTEDYDPARVQAILGAVDLSRVVHLTPKQADSFRYKDLMLPADRWAEQQPQGTWSELFDTSAAINRYPVLGLLVWYLVIFLLGMVVYPITRLALPGLQAKGYALSRIVGLVLLAYFPWLLGSLGVPYSRTTIWLTFAGLALTGGILAFIQRNALREDFRRYGKTILLMEGVFLLFFVVNLLIRLGNPDLWHPSKGGERPMDFSYFNAILKSVSFPPYDPWFAGGYINYYYYGFVLVGTPVKMLGIVPSIAYNFILPTLFAMIASAAFTIGASFIKSTTDHEQTVFNHKPMLLAGLAASVGTILIGNLGTIRLIFRALQRMAAPDGNIDQIGISIFQRWEWAIQGFIKSLSGANLPIGIGDWYWHPSRVIPAPNEVEPITEFPFFTFLYSDLHAHMIAMILVILSIGWVLSLVRNRGNFTHKLALPITFLIGALTIGALNPTNTWDIYTFLPLAAITVGYTFFRYGKPDARLRLPNWLQRAVLALGGMALLSVLSLLLYAPYNYWFGQAYGEIALWKGTHTPISSYLTHWGLFLFLIVSWLWWETHEWMAETPVSALTKLKPYRIWIEAAGAFFVAALIGLAILKVKIGWLALPIALWAAVLLFRPGQSDLKRLALFMIGTGITLTIVVEVIVLVGDISRMNTVFKLYLQAWMLLALSAAAATGWLAPELKKWTPNWRTAWDITLVVLLAGAGMFTIFATADKIRDRMNPEAPRTLNSMDFMQHASYWDGIEMDLSQDYRAIRWMQENVQGSPVIVEGNTVEYRWGSRYTVYTGLPGVVGWSWHQRQQRALSGGVLVSMRVDEVREFYSTHDPGLALSFLQKYNVRYIIVGQLERHYHPGAGTDKFETLNGRFWQAVYRDGETVIYEVLP